MIAQPAARRAESSRAFLIRAGLVLAGSALMALSARFSVNVGTVPITLQTLALPLVVAVLGTRLSVVAMVAYLAEGAAGMPVFAPTGHIGLAVLVGPTATTAGYLWAYPAAAWVIGTLYERGFGARFATRWLAVFAGVGIVIASGYGVLSLMLGPAAAFAFGVAPFWAADLAKVTVAAASVNAWPRLAALLRI